MTHATRDDNVKKTINLITVRFAASRICFCCYTRIYRMWWLRLSILSYRQYSKELFPQRRRSHIKYRCRIKYIHIFIWEYVLKKVANQKITNTLTIKAGFIYFIIKSLFNRTLWQFKGIRQKTTRFALLERWNVKCGVHLRTNNKLRVSVCYSYNALHDVGYFGFSVNLGSKYGAFSW